LLVAVVVGLCAGWLLGIVMGRGGYGLLGDLSLGLFGSTVAVWIFEAVGLVGAVGITGAMVAALLGTACVLVAQRKLWSMGV
jgi:uncharacterized membrane protein YeaQ/YmgE (transglycosylase-associated protein family)